MILFAVYVDMNSGMCNDLIFQIGGEPVDARLHGWRARSEPRCEIHRELHRQLVRSAQSEGNKEVLE